MVFYGSWVGWIAVCALAAGETLHFSTSPPPLGIVNLCSLLKYPKQGSLLSLHASCVTPSTGSPHMRAPRACCIFHLAG